QGQEIILNANDFMVEAEYPLTNKTLGSLVDRSVCHLRHRLYPSFLLIHAISPQLSVLTADQLISNLNLEYVDFNYKRSALSRQRSTLSGQLSAKAKKNRKSIYSRRRD